MKRLIGLGILGLLLSGCTISTDTSLHVKCWDAENNIVYDGEAESVVGIGTRNKDHSAFILFHTQSTEEKVVLNLNDKVCVVMN
jgi:hypothetical protein